MRSAVALGMLLTALPAAAEENRLGSPSVGYTLDKDAGGVRRIAGIPGASSFEAPLTFDGLRPIAVSSTARYVVALAEDGSVTLVRLATMERIPLDGAGRSPDVALTSPSGSALLLLWKDLNRAQIIKGFPDNPVVSFAVDLPGSASLASVDDAGSQALFSIRQDDADVLYRAKDGETAALQAADHIAAAEFAVGSADPLFADASAVYRFRDGSIERLADATDSVALFASGGTLFIAKPDRVVLLNISDLSSREIQCSCTVTTLRAMGKNVYRVTDATDAPLWVLDMGGTEPAFFFVPQAGGSHE